MSTNAVVANTAAQELYDHLRRKPLADLTGFERCIREDDELWAQLCRFADMRPPTLLWKRSAAFRRLYIFMAVRFLGGEDNVLRAESMHSRWQHLLRQRHSIKHPLLNAILKLSFASGDGGGLPGCEELLPHYTSVREEHIRV